MNPMNLIPAPYRAALLAAAVLLVVGVIYAAGHSHGAASVRAEWDAAKVVQQQAALAAEATNRIKEQSIMNKLEKAQNDATERETRLRADYSAVHAANVGLLNTVDALRRGLPGDTAEACRITADAALAVFEECSTRLGEVAEAADGHASDVRKLSDAWPE